MKSIEDIKIELTLKKLAGTLTESDIHVSLPKDDDLRTFVCSLGAKYAYNYAYYVDRKPNDETRKASCGDPGFSYNYAVGIDRCYTEETFAATSPNIERLVEYISHVPKAKVMLVEDYLNLKDRVTRLEKILENYCKSL
jgi:hypothetical protein